MDKNAKALLKAFFFVFLVLVKCLTSESEKTISPSVARKPYQPTIPLAVLGNSDSHSYADKIWFPVDEKHRGGKYRQQTLQWTEILATLRGAEIDQGKWGTWGTYYQIATIADHFGVQFRVPRKQDYEYNFAWSGAACSDLTIGPGAQSKQLLHLLAQDAKDWKNGIVLIRIGINTLGKKKFLDRVAEEGLSTFVVAEVNACTMAVESAIKEIRQSHPELKIVLVGILNNSDWPPYFQYWQSSIAQANINSALDIFDRQLHLLAVRDKLIAFFDDRANFRRYFGGRSAGGKPQYRSVNLAEGVVISNTKGDSSEHAILEDGHAGTLLNTLWSRDLINFLNMEWALGLTPISDQEIVDLVKKLASSQR